jgi:hypothetical protein
VQDLAEHDQLPSGNHPQEVAHQPVLEDRLVDRLELEDHQPVLAQGGGRGDVHRGEPRPGHPGGGAGRRGAQQGGHPLLGVHLADQHPLPGAGRQHRQGGGDRGLAHAALAGDDDQAAVEEGAWHAW